MLISTVFIFLGFLLLIKGADWLINGASSLARKNNVSDLAIGLTIVAFGTSAPELVVNSVASLENHSDIIFGNVIGSNIFNLFVILGIVGLIFPITVHSTTVWKEIPISLFALFLLYVFANSSINQGPDVVSRLEGIVLFAMFLLFLFYVSIEMKIDKPEMEFSLEQMPNSKIWFLIILGLAGLVIGARLVVIHAIEIATDLGISEKIIGLTVIAAGTSLPELITSTVAAFKKNSDIAIGNIIGSNIFNVLLVVSVSAFMRPIVFNASFNTDQYFLAAGTIFLFIAMFTGKTKTLDRWEAFILLIAFILYSLLMLSKKL